MALAKLVIGCAHDIFAIAPLQPAYSEMRSRNLLKRSGLLPKAGLGGQFTAAWRLIQHLRALVRLLSFSDISRFEIARKDRIRSNCDEPLTRVLV